MRIFNSPPLHATMTWDDLVMTLSLGTEDTRKELEEMFETVLTDEQLWQIWRAAAELVYSNFFCEMEYIRDHPTFKARLLALEGLQE